MRMLTTRSQLSSFNGMCGCSTPDKPVHCVVWAKELHKLLFGDSKSSYLFEDQHIGAQADTEEEASARKSGSTYMPCIDEMKELQPKEAAVETWARNFFDSIFHDEIARRLESAPETYKTAQHKPKPIALAPVETGQLHSDSTSSPGALKDQRVLSLLESAHLFIDTIKRFYQDESTRSSIGTLEFSKDSGLDLDLVTAATNLRAYTFGIPMQSRFDVKSIAGMNQCLES
jgi:ubiquitin-like 1-activating enzyme E1 B